MMQKLIPTMFFALLFLPGAHAQSFIKVAGSDSPGSQAELGEYWTGAAWVDVDSDDDLDLFLTNRRPGTTPQRNRLFIQENGAFTRIDTGALVETAGFWFGCSWADYDNDGDLDAYVAGLPGSLFRNEGGLHFTEVTAGAISQNSAAGVGAGWCDINRDGALDLLLVWPNWLAGPPWVGSPKGPQLFLNSGAPDHSFTLASADEANFPGPSSYIQPSFADYDDDGDEDAFIAKGDLFNSPDILMKNRLVESGNFGLQKNELDPITTTPSDGNHWQWMDLDNDGDLDAYVPNWAESPDGTTFLPTGNWLFWNEEGQFVQQDSGRVVTDKDLSTTSLWGDFDNDGDLDGIIVADSVTHTQYYRNDGNRIFTPIAAGELGMEKLHQSGGSVGDYNGDGALDLFIPGPGSHSTLYRNRLDNGNHWLKIKLRGTTSNASGIGAKVWMKAGEGWQRRDVSAANAFFGQNSLVQHFGLGPSILADSLRVEWPSGIIDEYASLPADEFYTLTEGEGLLPSSTASMLPQSLIQLDLFPNPADSFLNVRLELAESVKVELRLLDGQGRSQLLFAGKQGAGSQQYTFNLPGRTHPAGIYLLELRLNGRVAGTRKVLVH